MYVRNFSLFVQLRSGILSHYEVVNAPTVNTFKNRLDKLWTNQEVLYDYRVTINTGTWKP